MTFTNQAKTSRYHYNMIPFRFAQSEIRVGFSTEETHEGQSIAFKAAPEAIQRKFQHLKAEEEPKRLFLSFKPSESLQGFTFLVDMYQNKVIARHYALYLLYHYFLKQQAYLHSNFVQDLVVWLPDTKNTEYVQFSRIQLKVKFYQEDALPLLVMAYTGESSILLQSLKQLDECHPGATDAITKVIFDKQIYSFDRLPDAAHFERNKIFPLLNRLLARKLKISLPFRRVTNKHEVHWGKVLRFFDTKLKGIADTGLVFEAEWQRAARALMLEGSQLPLVFGQGQTDADIYQGLKRYGPYQPIKVRQLVCFFIYTAADEMAREKLQDALMPNSSYKGLGAFLKLSVHYDSGLDILIEKSDCMSQQVADQLSRKSLDPSLAYLAIYVSPFEKHTASEEHKLVYHQIKEVLLKRHIASQTIVGSKVMNPLVKLNYWVPNVAIAAIAKLGGIPWVLDKPHQPSLVVGFGLYCAQQYDFKYEGSSFAFSDDGHFRGFEYYPASETTALAARLEDALNQYMKQYGKPERMVIHYHKQMSKREFEPIRKMLFRYDPGLPFFVVRVNQGKTDDYFVRDTADRYGLPADGSVFRLSGQDYLVYVNRYDGQVKPKIQPMPVRCLLQASDQALLADEQTVKGLLQQVYDFSRLYWRSVNQPAMPVTVEYPRLLVEQTAWFDGSSIPGGLSELPWFL
ncbi:MAG: Piwi domain-containing protein [Bacteroidetes bacterium]|jgi:hypothetical protein|nr:Piwi domain-containing protein [Bacteroidota bacterium]